MYGVGFPGFALLIGPSFSLPGFCLIGGISQPHYLLIRIQLPNIGTRGIWISLKLRVDIGENQQLQ
jgi:hypothetical protein